MFTKIRIEATLKVLTGLHIGASSAFSAIGALDNPVIRDTQTADPMIPGSSLKGKLRTLLAKSMQPDGKYILPKCEKDNERIQALFGTPGDSRNDINPKTARLQFSDAFLTNREELTRIGDVTEIKYENLIDRQTSRANPRSMERVVRNAEFRVVIFYSVENTAEVKDDLAMLAKGLKLLSMDYLGGSGTRGYGRVCFKDFKLSCPLGEMPCSTDELTALFEEVSTYAASDL